MDQHFENAFAQYHIADKILFINLRKGTELTLGAAQRLTTDRLDFQNEKPFPAFYDITGVLTSTKAGRDYLAMYGCVLTPAAALYCQPHVTMTIAEYFLRFNRPAIPTGVFTNRALAHSFLCAFIK